LNSKSANASRRPLKPRGPHLQPLSSSHRPLAHPSATPAKTPRRLPRRLLSLLGKLLLFSNLSVCWLFHSVSELHLLLCSSLTPFLLALCRMRPAVLHPLNPPTHPRRRSKLMSTRTRTSPSHPHHPQLPKARFVLNQLFHHFIFFLIHRLP
jgi:hypothetical protein